MLRAPVDGAVGADPHCAIQPTQANFQPVAASECRGDSPLNYHLAWIMAFHLARLLARVRQQVATRIGGGAVDLAIGSPKPPKSQSDHLKTFSIRHLAVFSR